MVSSKSQRTAVVALTAGLVGCVAFLGFGNENTRMGVTQLSGGQTTPMFITFQTTNPSKDRFTFINTNPGQTTEMHSLPSLGLKVGTTSIGFTLSNKLGPLFCICTQGTDAWKGKLTGFKSNLIQYGGLKEFISLSKDDRGFKPCQRMSVDSIAKKLINEGMSETCEGPIIGDLSEIAISADANADKFDILAQSSNRRTTTISNLVDQIKFDVEQSNDIKSFDNAIEKYTLDIIDDNKQVKNGLLNENNILENNMNDISNDLKNMKSKCNIHPDGNTIWDKVSNLSKDVGNCVGAIRKFAKNVKEFGESVDDLPNVLFGFNDAMNNIVDGLKKMANYGDFIVQSVKDLTNQVRDLGTQLSKVNSALKDTQAETAASMNDFANDVNDLKDETKAKMNEITEQTDETANKMDELNNKVDELTKANEEMSKQHADMTAQIATLVAKLAELEEKDDPK